MISEVERGKRTKAKFENHRWKLFSWFRIVFLASITYLSITSIILAASDAQANEIMTDRCGGDVSFSVFYGGRPLMEGSHVLRRMDLSSTQWSLPFRVQTSGEGHIEWWCHSTAGNGWDWNTWKVHETYASKCNEYTCWPDWESKDYTNGVINGWTVERSRCDSRTHVIRVRLGRDHLLEIECLPDSLIPNNYYQGRDCTYGPQTCTYGYVWREAGPNDFVCVPPAVRDQAREDNSYAESRREPNGGPYGPNTCIRGYVWREAFPNDFVCVTPETRYWTQFENSQRYPRKACR